MRDLKLYIKDILAAMDAIEKFVEGMEFDEFQQDDKTSSAVIRKFEIIGEATKHVPESLRQKHIKIPWKQLAGMRDKLIHFYFGVNYDLVWDTLKGRIPSLKPMMHQVLKDLEDENQETHEPK